MANWLQAQWAAFTFWHVLLLPLSWLFGLIVYLRKSLYRLGWVKSYHLNVPVIIVGNINVGGSGKTPLVIWLAEQLRLAGYQPGIISRGYGGSARQVMEVKPDSSAVLAGDESILIATRTGCPVFISADRVAAGQQLLQAYPACNVIISDDGLQHYRLRRDVEIAVYDGVKGFGNGALLPAGPLRESRARLKSVDAVVCNGAEIKESFTFLKPLIMRLKASDFYNLLNNQQKITPADLAQQKILAIAGIGHPQRFFEQLRNLGLRFESRAYADHYHYQAEDFAQLQADVLLMTEKDAVKCRAFAQPNFWVLPVTAEVDRRLITLVNNKLNNI